jgi:RND family efflux transporter MFP subunit
MASTLRDDLASLKIDRRESYRPMSERRGGGGGFVRLASALIWLIPLGLLGGAGAVGYYQYDRLRPKTTVSVAPVQTMTTGEAEKLLSAKGYLKSRNQAKIGAKAPGRVESMFVEEGTRVKKGQVLAILEHNDLKAVLESRRAMIERSAADLKEAKSDLEVKERKAKRWTQLLARGTATVEETDGYVSARDMASARVRSVEAGLSLQKASMNEIAETIHNMHIIAPFNGTILTKEAEVGETITPGGMGAASGRGSVVTLADLDHLDVETDVAENLVSRIALGQPAEISVTAVPGRHYRGRLRQIIPMGDRTRGTIKVNVEVIDPDIHLFPELVATVHFLPDKAVANPNASKAYLFLPKAAVFEENGHSYAWVIDGKGVARRRGIEVVTSTDDLARVEKGLTVGEMVVVNPPKTLHEGEAVKIDE